MVDGHPISAKTLQPDLRVARDLARILPATGMGVRLLVAAQLHTAHIRQCTRILVPVCMQYIARVHQLYMRKRIH